MPADRDDIDVISGIIYNNKVDKNIKLIKMKLSRDAQKLLFVLAIAEYRQPNTAIVRGIIWLSGG